MSNDKNNVHAILLARKIQSVKRKIFVYLMEATNILDTQPLFKIKIYFKYLGEFGLTRNIKL